MNEKLAEEKGDKRDKIHSNGYSSPITHKKRFAVAPANYLEMLEREIWRLNGERDATCHILHEDVIQLLVAAKNYLHVIEHTDCNKVGETITKVDSLIAIAFQKIKNIHQQIASPPFSLFGLSGAIEELISNASKNARVQINIKKLDTDVNQIEDYEQLAVYRIFKELVENSLQHARANNIELALSLEKDFILMNYVDNGIGFYNSKRFWRTGLLQIESLIQTFNGKMNISTAPGIGFKFYAQIQLIPRIYEQ